MYIAALSIVRYGIVYDVTWCVKRTCCVLQYSGAWDVVIGGATMLCVVVIVVYNTNTI